jgi:hypothetical protein
MSMQAQILTTTAAQRYAGCAATGNSGEDLKRRGQEAVIAKAPDEWKERAIYLLRIYVAGLATGALFAMEDARAYMDLCGLGQPHDHHAWGSLPRLALSAGIPIERTDRTRKASSPKTRSHPVSLWRRL